MLLLLLLAIMVDAAIEAANTLSEEGIKAKVINTYN